MKTLHGLFWAFIFVSGSVVAQNNDEDDWRKLQPLPATEPSEKAVQLALRSNLLSDVLLLPSLGLEARLSDWSLSTEWSCAWWSMEKWHYYWRGYGGDLSLRRHFHTDFLTDYLPNPFVGVYAGFGSYDFELGETGRMADPAKDKLEYSSGLECGVRFDRFTFFSLELSLGIGCAWGKYDEYRPLDGHYLWQRSRRHHTWGPNRIRVSFCLPLDIFGIGKEVTYEN